MRRRADEAAELQFVRSVAGLCLSEAIKKKNHLFPPDRATWAHVEDCLVTVTPVSSFQCDFGIPIMSRYVKNNI